ncbi:MAG: helix-turn-helix transcriptional regulator [Actinocatenispora sp.]
MAHSHRRTGGQTGSQRSEDDALELSELIRDLRLSVGWSQARLADELCRVSSHATVTRETISRWESGKRRPGTFWLRHLATALQTPLATFDEAVRMQRRTFLTDLAATAIAPLAAADLVAHGFVAALRTRPSVDDWQGRLYQYGQDYMILGAGEIRKRLASDLVVLQQQLDSPGMWDVAAKLMTLYGKTFPGADGAKAAGWYRMAAVAADRSENPDSREWVRGRAAIALGYEGASLPVASMFAEQALAVGSRPSLGRLNAIMGRAHAAAIAGDRASALELVDEGRHVFDVAGSSADESSDYAVPWWRMNVFISLLAARLGDEHLADEAQRAALAELPDTLPRFRTHLEMHQGLMLARSGDRPGGVAHAEAALAKLPPEKHSLTLRMLLTEIKGDNPVVA